MARSGFLCHLALSTFLLLTCSTYLVADPIPAFPGAEGFGSTTPGGRGGRILWVENLEDYRPGTDATIPGSLRAALDTKGPRTILFAVSGTIVLKETLSITRPFVTVAGQSAPGDGICLRDWGLSIRANDVVVRYLRVRPGDVLAAEMARQGKAFAPDAISIAAPSRNVVVDHCSVGWAIDECLSVSGAGITDVTVQRCLISESLTKSYHEKGSHGYGSLLRCNGNVTFHHNIYAHHSSRSPRPGTYGSGSILLDFRNNVIFDSRGYSAQDPVRMNYVGNFIRKPRKDIFRIGGLATRMYVADNELDGSPLPEDPWTLIGNVRSGNKESEPFPVAPVRTDAPRGAYESILRDIGANRPSTDEVDRRVLKQLESGTGKLINSQADVGGWPELETAPLPSDLDRDGLPDAWERKHGLNPMDPADSLHDRNGDGYTNLEEYLHELAQGRQ